MKRVGLAFTGSEPIERYAETAMAAERRGFESFWVAEDYFFRDSISTAGYVAAETESINLGVFVNAYTRHPALLAMTVASLDEMTDGKILVGMGSGSPSVMEQIVEFEKPLGRVKSSVEFIRELLTTNSYTGERGPFSIENVTIGKSPLLPFMGRFNDFSDDVPVYVAGKGPQMLKMAGDVGDGLVVSIGYSPGMVKDALNRVHQGLAIRDRARSEFDVAGFILCTSDIDDRAREFTARFVANAPDPGSLHLENVGVEDIRRLRDAFDTDGIDAAKDYTTNEMVESLVVVGNIAECCRQLDRYVNSGVDAPILTYLGPEPTEFVLDVGEAWAREKY